MGKTSGPSVVWDVGRSLVEKLVAWTCGGRFPLVDRDGQPKRTADHLATLPKDRPVGKVGSVAQLTYEQVLTSILEGEFATLPLCQHPFSEKPPSRNRNGSCSTSSEPVPQKIASMSHTRTAREWETALARSFGGVAGGVPVCSNGQQECPRSIMDNAPAF